jgi:insertion element IS1 protein InsB
VYIFGRRQDTVFLTLKALLELFGVTRYFTADFSALITASATFGRSE